MTDAPVPPRPDLGAGVRTALLRGLVVFVVVLGVVVANTIVVAELLRGTGVARGLAGGAGGGTGLGLGSLSRSLEAGVLQFEAAFRVPIEVPYGPLGGDVGVLPPELMGGGTLTVTVVPMLFTLLALALVFQGGRAAGLRAGGTPTQRTLIGALTALPVAVGAIVLAFTVTARFGSGGGLDSGAFVEVAASRPGVLLWPLALGGLAGALGGLRAADEALLEGQPLWAGRLQAALVGGWRMLWVGMLLALVGLQVVSGFESGLPIPYGPGFQSQIRRAGTGPYLGALDLAALGAPNVAAWVLVPSMGACDEATGRGPDRSIGIDLVCYSSFPGPDFAAEGPEGLDRADLPPAPSQYLLFLLVPAVATLGGGVVAARRVGTRSHRDGAVAGALAGVVFALGVLVVALLARVSVDVSAAGSPGVSAVVGPQPYLGALLALAWGLAGGAAGGAIAVRAPRRD